jgi:spore germination protein
MVAAATRRRLIGRHKLLIAIAALGLCACSGVATAAQGTGRPLQAYLLTSSPDSLRDLRAHARSISVLYPTYYDCSVPGGRVIGQPDAAVTAYARSQRIAVLPRFNCQDRATVHAILTQPALRATTISRLVAIARDRAYAGLNLDLENDGAADRKALTSFVATLAGRLHTLHKKLSVVVVGVGEDDPKRSTGFYDDRALVALADSVFVLAWGAHWEGSGPGPIAPLDAAIATASYLASLPHHARFVLGAPMYGLDWPEGERATAYQYSDIVALAHALHAHVRSDSASHELTFAYTDAEGVPHRVWSMNAAAVAALLRIGRAHGLGMGVWRLGEEDQSLWSSAALSPAGE